LKEPNRISLDVLEVINVSYAFGLDNISNIAGTYLLGFNLILFIMSASDVLFLIISDVSLEKFNPLVCFNS
jgi:hypothetical protein